MSPRRPHPAFTLGDAMSVVITLMHSHIMQSQADAAAVFRSSVQWEGDAVGGAMLLASKKDAMRACCCMAWLITPESRLSALLQMTATNALA
jgi:hypothetical protein